MDDPTSSAPAHVRAGHPPVRADMSHPGDAREREAHEGPAFEQLVSDLTASFVSVVSRDLDAAIQQAQRQIGEALDLDRVSLFEFHDHDLLLRSHWSRSP